MSHIWEANIKEWYDKSRTAHLEYLDLSIAEKISRKDIAHNISVIYDRTCLSSKVAIKDSYLVREQIQNLEHRISKLEKGVKNLTTLVRENRPLSSEEVRSLVLEIAKQPKTVEKQALELTEEVKEQVKQIKNLLHVVQTTLG